MKSLAHRPVIDIFEQAVKSNEAFDNDIDVPSQQFAVRSGLDNQVSLSTEWQRDDLGSRRLGRPITDCRCDHSSVTR
ncbi:hypothetical protein IVB18_50570 (plasmid) [Bradyrhizobium sp. 186]|uniref:hypothetical protein n=1 Tax=Bradyrhizobium sp. 186 TaxID=2782654 RepID=UPI002000B963|nr:hypothetical protein [Bradyrhizobium sp. 186]UPK40869.1 hypothetical protein IVB18_50570 [Bradyrhizobium sp. 186]